ncbi:enterochelin esterase [Hafnia psychrotolerans]|nr:enterochelin esterase [Hafnia psychrotolerans]
MESESESGAQLSSRYAGSNRWWLDIARRGTPWIEPSKPGHWKVTFFWRDPQGNEFTSACQHVWINITGKTDHHQTALPQSLQRLTGTDVWFWQTDIEAGWRGSYSFMPVTESHPFIPPSDDPHANMMALRHWWSDRFTTSTHDILNAHRSWSGGRGHRVSGLHMPDALPQSVWRDFDNFATGCGRCTPAPPTLLQKQQWHSPRLGNSRTVWVYTTGDSDPTSRPLAILLDGQFWSQEMPVWEPLHQLTEQGKLPEAVYLLIEAIDIEHRSRELTCNADFWLAVQEELLPQLRVWAPYRDSPDTTLVAGQSFGGLSALYACLHWPQTFGCALSQSGSFWWPQRQIQQAEPSEDQSGWLLRQIEQGVGQAASLKIFMEAGVHERLIHRMNGELVKRLQQTSHQLHYRDVVGGHDALCWRGGLMDGLAMLWSPHFVVTTAAVREVEGVCDGKP